MLITIFFTFLFVCVSIAILVWVKTPIYRVRAENVESLLQLVLTGQATPSDWDVFLGYPIRTDEFLESVRQRCVEIDECEYCGDVNAPYLFTATGLRQLDDLLRQVRQYRHLKPDT